MYHLIGNFNSVPSLGWGFCTQFVRHGSTFLAIVTPSLKCIVTGTFNRTKVRRINYVFALNAFGCVAHASLNTKLLGSTTGNKHQSMQWRSQR